MNKMLAGEPVDRRPWVPSIYEHGAALLGQSPGPVSRDASLMAQAAIDAYRTYSHDLVTVGIDIYNVEAEAFGCEVSDGSGKSIPGVIRNPLGRGQLNAAGLDIPLPGPNNRLGLIAQAVEQVIERIGRDVWVYGCMGGPFSQAVELRGFERLIGDICDDPDAVHALLDRTAELALQQARRIASLGAGVNLFESWATLPLIDPSIFGTFVVPYNKRVIEAVRAEFKTPPPAVIMGGDTTILIDFLQAVGTGVIAPDYMTDLDFIQSRIGGSDVIIRGCVDPKMIERGDWAGLEVMIGKLAAKSAGLKRFVWGCGCVSYDTTVENLLHFKQMCLGGDL